MLDSKTIQKIEDFVRIKPRSIQEISQHLKKNWRTIDRYVEKIEKDFGTLSVRIFRKGTRGALKIVYTSPTENISDTVFQEELEKQIFEGRESKDFSAFDIFQHVKTSKKIAYNYSGNDEVNVGKLDHFADLLKTTKKQILFFSGNLSFVNYKDKKTDIFKVIEGLVKKGISIKVVCRIGLAGEESVRKLLSLNFKYGKELVEVKHRYQPLRITLIDGKVINMKEVKLPTGRTYEPTKKHFIFYTIKDKEWGQWMSRIFWKMFNNAIGSEKRLQELEKIKIRN